VIIVVGDISEPVFTTAVNLKSLGLQIYIGGVIRILDSAVAQNGKLRVKRLTPFLTLALSIEEARAVRGVAGSLEVALELGEVVSVPVDVCSRVVIFDVIYRSNGDITRCFTGAHEELRSEVVTGNAHGVQVGVAVLAGIFRALTRSIANTVDESGERKNAIKFTSPDEPALMDLAKLGSVLDPSCCGTGFCKCREKKSQQECDNGHNHQQFDECKTFSCTHKSCSP
jgi:hypothetical protein